MRFRSIMATGAAAVMALAVLAGPAAADHEKGKKFRNVELTRQAAIEAGDNFGVAPVGTSGSGDLYLNNGKNRFCAFLDFEVVEGDAILALHLHEKADGSQNGPVVIQLSGLLNADGTMSEGCVTGVDREILRGVLSAPDDYYVNAHTSDLTVVRVEMADA